MITEEQLFEAGFTRVKKNITGTEFLTDTYILPGWSPTPYVDWEYRTKDPQARIGAVQHWLRKKADIDEFIGKIVPVFCDKTE
jgi:hypothetical protein